MSRLWGLGLVAALWLLGACAAGTPRAVVSPPPMPSGSPSAVPACVGIAGCGPAPTGSAAPTSAYPPASVYPTDPYPTGAYPTGVAGGTSACPSNAPSDAAILSIARKLADGPLPAGAAISNPRCASGYLVADLTATGRGTILVVVRQTGETWYGVAIGSYPCKQVSDAPPEVLAMLNCG